MAAWRKDRGPQTLYPIKALDNTKIKYTIKRILYLLKANFSILHLRKNTNKHIPSNISPTKMGKSKNENCICISAKSSRYIT